MSRSTRKRAALLGALLASLIAILIAAAAPLGAHELLPLGDGKISAMPQVGHLMSCQQRFNPNAPGAHREGPWIQGDVWRPDEKPSVEGQVTWPESRIEVTVEGARRVVRANNLPRHPTGVFPIARDSEAYRYDRNPGRIRAQDILLTLPRMPQVAAQPSCVPMGMIGFMLSGAALYNAVDARGKDAPAHEMQDRCHGHPQQSGQYHYHDGSPCLEDTASQPGGHSDLVGYALDGFGIFGTRGENGAVLTTADLDACHGHSHEIEWDGEQRALYHYHLTRDYPYSVGCFQGTPARVAGAVAGPPDGVAPRREPRRGGPLAGAAAELGIPERALADALGRPPPDVRRAARILGISEARIRQALRNNRPR